MSHKKGYITTSYFAVCKNLEGTKISIARKVPRFFANGVSEKQPSFAPSSELLQKYKSENIHWGHYVQTYLAEQRQHFRENPEDFEDLFLRAKEGERLVLLCYERFEGLETRCHRMILRDILQQVADHWEHDVRFVDEKPYR
jgi:uncharacterized protein YeaO (DUF488 family)